MKSSHRRNSTGSLAINEADLALPGAPGRQTRSSARYAGLPRSQSDDLQSHLRAGLRERRDEVIGGQEDEEWDNPIAREDRAQEVIERMKVEQQAELDGLAGQQLVGPRVAQENAEFAGQERAAPVIARMQEEQEAELGDLAGMALVGPLVAQENAEFAGQERAAPVIARMQEEQQAELDALAGQRLVSEGDAAQRYNRDMVTRLRGDQQEADVPFTLHAMQGMSAVDELLAELRPALLRYVRAIRAKDALRDEYRVDKLRKMPRKQKKNNPALPERIAAVRQEKDTAKAEFRRLRDTVNDYLANPAWQRPEIIEQINEIDREVAGVSDEEIDARVEHEATEADQRRAEVSKVGKLAVTLELSEANYHRLLREVRALTDAGVGSKDFEIKISLGGGFAGFMSASGGISYSGSTNIQDDRRLRVSRTWGAFGGVQAELAAVLAADATIGYGRSSTEVFIDAEHWAADMAFRLGTIEKMLARLGRGDDFDASAAAEELYDEQEAGELMATKSIAEHDAVTQVTSNSLSAGASGKVLGYGASYGYKRSWMTFEKDGADGARKRRQATQGQHTFTLSVGKLSATFTRTKIDNHANPDNDGTYWNIKLAVGGEASAKLEGAGEEAKEVWLQELEASLLDHLDATEGSSSSGFATAEQQLVDGSKAALAGGHGGDFAKGLAGYLDQALLSLDASIAVANPFEIGLTGSGQLAVEWNVLWNSKEKARLQYRRFSKGKSMGVSGSVQAGATPLTIGFGASKGKSTMISEKLGSDTATYLQTVFDALRLRDKRDVDLGRAQQGLAQWRGFIGGHQTEIWRFFRSIASGSSKALGEIQGEAQGAVSYAQDHPGSAGKARATASSAQRFIDACAGQADALAETTVDEALFAELAGLLTTYFERLAQLNADVQAEKWQTVT